MFDPTGAVRRVGHADDLVVSLTISIEQQWLPFHPVQCAVHLRVTDALACVLE